MPVVDGNPAWRVIRLSALDHPNIYAQLRGNLMVIPYAVTLEQVSRCQRRTRLPTQGTYGAWSTALFDQAINALLIPRDVDG